jgi:hypothetical protein
MKMKKKLLIVSLIAATFFSCSKEEIAPETQVSEAGYKIVEKNAQLYLYPVSDMATLNESEIAFTQEINSYLKDARIFPSGVVRNEAGEINLEASKTGKTYTVQYPRTNARLMQKETLVLSGISYQTGVYELAKGATVAQAIYNGDSSQKIPQGYFEMVNEQQQTVQQMAQGDIDLKTLAQAAGPGIYKVNYSLDDESNFTQNSTALTVYIYETLEDVPSELLNSTNRTARMNIEEEDTELIIVTR